ncbi:MAG: HAD hydrolase-like protein [Nanoarchaeota archaeon]
MPDLILFDIDGTLVDLTEFHISSYQDAYEGLTKKYITRDRIHEKLGLPEMEIHKQLFEEENLKFSESGGGRIINKYSELFFSKLKEKRTELLSGVLEFLVELKRRKNYLGIVTGNIEEMGREILKNLGIEAYFSVFGFDRNQQDGRAGIVRDAIDEAIKNDYSYKKVIVIGDTPKDIKSGKANKVYTVGVATGRYSLEDLQNAEPDLAIQSLEKNNFDKIIAIMEEC